MDLRNLSKVMQLLIAVIAALASADLGDKLMTLLYEFNRGHLTPYQGLPWIYITFSNVLRGAIPAALAYIILYSLPNKSMIVSGVVALVFATYSAFFYIAVSPEVSLYSLKPEILIGGGAVIVAYEVIRRQYASN